MIHFRKNPRALFLTAALLFSAIVLVAGEHRPSFLRPGLRLNAYVTADDGSVSVVDLVKLRTTARISIGPGLSGMREHPSRPEIWGVSSLGGYAWILEARSNQVVRIPVGALPYALDFSPSGNRAYITASGEDSLISINCVTRTVVARSPTGRGPVLARVTPDGNNVLVANARDSSLGIHDASSLLLRVSVPVVAHPEDIAVLPDSSVAFVLSRSEARVSVVDLRRGLLLTNLELAGKPSQMLLKPDGGELYVISPESHGLQVINTWTFEVGDYVVLGSTPTHAVMFPDGNELFVTDTEAGRVTPVDMFNRRVSRPIPAGDSPGALRLEAAAVGENPSLLLVVNQGSGDLSVIRVRSDSDSLLTMIPVGYRPQELAVKLF